MSLNQNVNDVKSKVKLILDTDMGNDIDDALAMAMIHGMQNLDECELLGVVSSKDTPKSPVYIDILNTFYGRPDIPIGYVANGVTPEERTFLPPIVTKLDGDKYRYKRKYKSEDYFPAVDLLRKILAEQEDDSVVLLMIGFSTNIAQLFDSGSDQYSDLSGIDLFAKKVQRVVAMAGDFSEEVQNNPTLDNREYNVHCDVESAVRFFNFCPKPIIFCGYEIGLKLRYPHASIESDFNYVKYHPVADAYRFYKQMPYDRPLWDPATVLEAVRPGCQNFTYSKNGTVQVDHDGIMLFEENDNGMHLFLNIDESQLQKTVDEIVELCVQAPLT